MPVEFVVSASGHAARRGGPGRPRADLYRHHAWPASSRATQRCAPRQHDRGDRAHRRRVDRRMAVAQTGDLAAGVRSPAGCCCSRSRPKWCSACARAAVADGGTGGRRACAQIAAFPLAIPLMAGPGAITATVLLAGRAPAIRCVSALLIGVIAAVFLLSSWLSSGRTHFAASSEPPAISCCLACSACCSPLSPCSSWSTACAPCWRANGVVSVIVPAFQAQVTRARRARAHWRKAGATSK